MAALPAVWSPGRERWSSGGIGNAATYRRPPQMLPPRPVRNAFMVPQCIVGGVGVPWPWGCPVDFSSLACPHQCCLTRTQLRGKIAGNGVEILSPGRKGQSGTAVPN